MEASLFTVVEALLFTYSHEWVSFHHAESVSLGQTSHSGIIAEVQRAKPHGGLNTMEGVKMQSAGPYSRALDSVDSGSY